MKQGAHPSDSRDSLLPLIQQREADCQKRIESARQEAQRLVAEAKEKAKQVIEETEGRVRVRETERLQKETAALEAELAKEKEKDREKLKALEAELRKRLPHASEEILKMIFPS